MVHGFDALLIQYVCMSTQCNSNDLGVPVVLYLGS
jgi:hypothetical protein